MPWSVDLWRKYRKVLTTASLLRLRRALIAERRGTLGFADEIELKLRRPYSTSIRLRPRSNDLCTFDEVFLDCVYADTPPATTVLDLGANIGLSAIDFLSRFPGCRIVVVEPDHGNLALLAANLKACGERVTVIAGAVWPEPGLKRFAPSREPGHVNSGALADGDGGYDVPVFPVDAILNHVQWPAVDLVKMDIEGAEATLFARNTDWLERAKALAVEFHGDSRRESGFDDVVARHGFRVKPGSGHTVVAVKETL